MSNRIIIYADDGMVLTNGTTYGKTIYLADGESADTYYQISEDEYNATLPVFDEDVDLLLNEATETDYISALSELGVKL